MPTPLPEVIAFLDANFCIHFRHGDEIKWLAWFNAKRVRVVICWGVYDELERLKADPRHGRHAAWWLKLIEPIAGTTNTLAMGDATLEFFSTAAAAHSNSASVGDVAIREQALECRDANKGSNPDAVFKFVSDDGPSRVRARMLGLDAVDPKETQQRRPDEKAECRGTSTYWSMARKQLLSSSRLRYGIGRRQIRLCCH